MIKKFLGTVTVQELTWISKRRRFGLVSRLLVAKVLEWVYRISEYPVLLCIVPFFKVSKSYLYENTQKRLSFELEISPFGKFLKLDNVVKVLRIKKFLNTLNVHENWLKFRKWDDLGQCPVFWWLWFKNLEYRVILLIVPFLKVLRS